MSEIQFSQIFTKKSLETIFPKERSDQFFENLYGDSSEGAYDIRLEFSGYKDDSLNFEFHLIQRPGKCLACNLTYGLPQVFVRHPVINIKGMIEDFGNLLKGRATCGIWEIGRTKEVSNKLHIVPLVVSIQNGIMV